MPAEKDSGKSFSQLREEFTRFVMGYKFGIDEIMTKINILREEFNHVHEYNPIEYVGSRLKSPESILAKALRKGCPITMDDIRDQILDIAGIRVTCSFLSDTYKIRDMIAAQHDITVLLERDYIANPKPNGYKSLHLIVSVPVYMSDRVVQVTVEIQIRTIAMDFWASLEHKIFYKYRGSVPAAMVEELAQAAAAANALDKQMEKLHVGITQIKRAGAPEQRALPAGDLSQLVIPQALLDALQSYRR
nr:GTP pyrophosphokinase family protein [Nakamurella antarctica]